MFAEQKDGEGVGHLFAEDRPGGVFVLRAPLVRGDDFGCGLALEGFTEMTPHLGAERGETLDFRAGGGKLLGDGQTRFFIWFASQLQAVDQGSDADFEELVEVGLEDREEGEPFAERHIVPGSLAEHALVELEPTQFAVDEEVLPRLGGEAGQREVALIHHADTIAQSC